MPLINLKLLCNDFLPEMLEMENKINDKEHSVIEPTHARKYKMKFGPVKMIAQSKKYYLVNQPSTAKLGGKTITEHLLEPFLVMIITILARVVDTSNIKHSIKALQHLRHQNKTELLSALVSEQSQENQVFPLTSNDAKGRTGR